MSRCLVELEQESNNVKDHHSIRTNKYAAVWPLQLFSHHYPERMGTFYMIEAPYIFSKLYKLLSPYIDPVTASKLIFLKGPTGKGGGEDLRETLGKHFDEELVEWLVKEMLENRYYDVHPFILC